MNGKGPKFERETIIRFDEDSDKAEIWTASETVYRRLLKRLGRAYLTEDGQRHAVFTFPVAFMQLPRPKRQVTEAQRQAGRRMRQAVLSQNGEDNPSAQRSKDVDVDEGVRQGEHATSLPS